MGINLGNLDVLGQFAKLKDEEIIQLVLDNGHGFKALESSYFDVQTHPKSIVLRTAVIGDTETYDIAIRLWKEGVPGAFLEIYHEDNPNLANWQVTTVDATYRWADCRDVVHFTLSAKGEPEHNFGILGLVDLRKIMCAMLVEIGISASA